ncbi:MAG: tetratricopeptide repeat protein [Chloroflexota bacterium]|nr:MAG: tetratricopeptide repeat protein [Chloroflexota bacterium]TMD85186.1 MAG: tetratricopeptide repeat protein [Chloroflexota bacterium]
MLTKGRPGRSSTASPGAPGSLGQRIRSARQELGLTLAAVAGKDFTRAFLNQVELGRAQPSTQTLRIIAQRLQRPIDYFLEEPGDSVAALELALAEAEMSLLHGEAARAESLMTRILARTIPLELRTRAQLTLGTAYVRQGEPKKAMPVLEEAIAAAERSNWPQLLVELYDRMGSVHYLLRRAHTAGQWFEQAFERYESAGLTDPILKARILGHRANLHYVAGQPVEAIAAYESAIAAAEEVLDMPALAGIYEGLALSFQQTGQYARALSYAQRGLRIFETLRDVRMAGALRLNMGEMLLQQGRVADAERLFTEGAERLRRIDDRELLPLLVVGMAESALERDDPERASDLIEQALDLATRSSDPIAGVAVHRVAGRVAHARGRHETAHRHFERALDVALTVDSPDLRARVTYDYARALEAEGDAAQAALRFRQAYEAGRGQRTRSGSVSQLEA